MQRSHSRIAAVAAVSGLLLLLTLVSRSSRPSSLLALQQLPSRATVPAYYQRLGSLRTHPRFARNQKFAVLRPFSLAENPTWAPEGGYTKYKEDLPPAAWGENFDGKNFHEPFHTQIPTKYFKDGEYWKGVVGEDEYPLEFSEDENVGPIFQDNTWSDDVWCPNTMCDITSEASPDFDLNDFPAAV